MSAPRVSRSSPIGAADHRHQLLDFAALIGLVPGSNRVLDTVADVIPQYFLLEPPQGRADRRDLRHDIDAVPVLFHHAGEPADLTLDACQPFGA